MLDEVASVISRNRQTLGEDLAGAVALIVILLAGLHLPLLV